MVSIIKRKNGITLITLVITIIILLILAGIAIATLTGDNGILSKASTAKDATKQEEGREIIKLAIEEMRIEKLEKGEKLTLDYIGDFIHEKLKIEKEDVTKNGDPTKTVDVIYEDIEYEIDESFQIEIIGSIGEGIRIEGRYELKGNYAILYITAKTESKDGIKQVIKPDDETIVYTNKEKEINVEYRVENDEEYRFIVEGNNGRKRRTTIKVEGIDHNPPNEAIITIKGSPTYVGGSIIKTITVTTTVSDNKSGIDIEKCKYIIDNSSSKVGIDSKSWETAKVLEGETTTIEISSNTAKTQYMHVLSVNKSGNKIETVSKEIEFELDDILPEDAEITLSATRVDEGSSYTVTMKVDDSQTGINQGECKYIINESNSAIGENATAWDSAMPFTKNPEVWSGNASGAGKTYYFHVLSVDMAGNKKENISEGIYVAGVMELLNVYNNDNSLDPKYVTNTGDWMVTTNNTYKIVPKDGADATITSVREYDLSNINQVEWFTNSTSWTPSDAKGYFCAEVLNLNGSVMVSSDVSNYAYRKNHTLVCDVSSLKGKYKLRLKLVGKYWCIFQNVRCRLY